MNLEFLRQIFGKYSNIEFSENPSVGAELFYADRQTDRHFVNAPTIFRTKVIEKLKTRFMFNTFFPKIVPFVR